MSDAGLRNVKGLSECLQNLRELPPDLRKKLLGRATNNATAVVRDQARADAPEYTGPVQRGHPPPGTLKKSIIMVRVGERSTETREAYIVTVRRGATATRKKGILLDAFYWFWVEFGSIHNEVRHYMRDALPKRVDEAIDKFAGVIRGGLPGLLKKKH
jgi:HK97 gp10 family phage protein